MSLTPSDYFNRAYAIAAQSHIDQYHINSELGMESLSASRRTSFRNLFNSSSSSLKEPQARYTECYHALRRLKDLETAIDKKIGELDISPESACVQAQLDENRSVLRIAGRRVQKEQRRLINEAPAVQALFTQAMLHKDRLVSYINQELGLPGPLEQELEEASLEEVYSLMKKRLIPSHGDHAFPSLKEYFVQAVDSYARARKEVANLWHKNASTTSPLHSEVEGDQANDS